MTYEEYFFWLSQGFWRRTKCSIDTLLCSLSNISKLQHHSRYENSITCKAISDKEQFKNKETSQNKSELQFFARPIEQLRQCESSNPITRRENTPASLKDNFLSRADPLIFISQGDHQIIEKFFQVFSSMRYYFPGFHGKNIAACISR